MGNKSQDMKWQRIKAEKILEKKIGQLHADWTVINHVGSGQKHLSKIGKSIHLADPKGKPVILEKIAGKRRLV